MEGVTGSIPVAPTTQSHVGGTAIRFSEFFGNRKGAGIPPVRARGADAAIRGKQ
jgi:hypothetical protein